MDEYLGAPRGPPGEIIEMTNPTDFYVLMKFNQNGCFEV